MNSALEKRLHLIRLEPLEDTVGTFEGSERRGDEVLVHFSNSWVLVASGSGLDALKNVKVGTYLRILETGDSKYVVRKL